MKPCLLPKWLLRWAVMIPLAAIYYGAARLGESVTPGLLTWNCSIWNFRLRMGEGGRLTSTFGTLKPTIHLKIPSLKFQIPNQWRVAEAVLLLVLLLVVSQMVFGSSYLVNEYMLIPLLLWAAVRFGQWGAAISILIVSGIALWATIHGFGPFGRESLNKSLPPLLSFVGIITIPTLALIAARQEHQQAEVVLKQAKQDLEIKVEELTTQLKQANEQILREFVERQKTEDALRESNRQIASILESITDGFVALDNQWRYTYINQRAAQRLQRRKQELLGKNIWEEFPSAVGSTSYNEYHKAVTEHFPVTFEEYDLPMDTWFEVRAFPSHNGLYILWRDITSRKQAEAALYQSNRQLVEAQKVAHVGSWEFDLTTFQMTWSEELFRIFGLEPTQPAPTYPEYLQKVHPDDVEVMTKAGDRAITEGKAYEFDHRIVLPDGSIRHIFATGQPMFNDEGRVVKIFGTALDITERKRAEEILRHSEAQLREQATQLEQALHQLQKTQTQLIQTEKMSSLGQLVAGVAHEINNPVSFIFGNVGHASEYIQDLLHLLSLYQQHYPQPVPEIQDTITEIDLDFIIQDLPKLLSSMKLGANRIRQIVLSLRNFSRLDEAGMKPVDIHEGIDNTLLILQNRLKETPRHPAIQIIKEYGQLPLVECYAGQLNQVFMNLLTNAIDALELGTWDKGLGTGDWGLGNVGFPLGIRGNGEWRLGENSFPCPQSPITNHQSPIPTIRIRTSLIDGTRVAIGIADNGSGMTEDVKKRLFDPFFTTKPVGKGTGLGLAISYQIVVEKHQGQLTCFSAPGQGTEFLIEIPIRQKYKG